MEIIAMDGEKPIEAEKLIELFERRQENVPITISPQDGMYFGNSDHYFHVGQSALQSVKLAMLAAGKKDLKRILDLPCGHGRVLRSLRAAFPQAELVACDLLEDGVNFCASEFGAVPIHAQEEPENIPIEGQFDLIWCGSLLTHLDSDRWMGFIKLFNSLLSANGLMVVTTHGRYVVQKFRGGEDYGLEPDKLQALLANYDRDGFGFGNYFHSSEYGVSVSSPSWVCAQLEKLPNLRLVNFAERGWDNHQDAFSCLKIPD